MAQQTAVMAEPMLERAGVYRVLSRLYAEPLSDDALAAFAADDFKAMADAASEDLEREGYNDMYRYLRRRNTATGQELRADYTQTFGGVREYNGVPAVPYESMYVTPDGETRMQVRLGVLRTYKVWQVRVDEELEIAEDHLSFEMEFMAMLAERCAAAAEEGDADAARELALAQSAFMRDHLAKWYGRFIDLASRLVTTRFYEGVLKVTRAYLDQESAYLAELERTFANTAEEAAGQEPAEVRISSF